MQTFKKHERLCSRKIIDQLFLSGRSFKIYPFIVNWNEIPVKDSSPLQVMMAVSSRMIRNAPDRNHIRRLMKEAYRKNKASFIDYLNRKNRTCGLIIIFTGKTKLTFTEAEHKIILILQRLQKEYDETPG
jgi:ribonuclease P protein component